MIATYSDSWLDLPYRTLAGASGGLPKRSASTLVDYGPVPSLPEASSDAPAWRGTAEGALVYASTAGHPHAYADWLRRADVPTVVMISDLIDTELPAVCVDYHELGRIAADHFVEDCECRSFVHVGRRGVESTVRRENSFRDALALHGHDLQACRINVVDMADDRTPRPLDEPEVEKLLRTLPRPIGVFTMSDKCAARVAATCRRLGLRLPQDVALLGVNNTMFAHTHSPSLSSIRIREAEVGRTAIRLLLDLMRGAAPPREPVLVGGCELYARTSTMGKRQQRTVLTVDVAMERIQASACSGLTVDRLAEILGVSRRMLELLFCHERDSSPNQEIQRVRFETAAQLLRTSSLSVSQIAEMTGFAFAPSFCRFFQRMSGVTPMRYRRGPHADADEDESIPPLPERDRRSRRSPRREA